MSTSVTPSPIQSLVNSLLARSATLDPVLLTVLQEMLNELNRLGIEVFGPPIIPGKPSSGATGTPVVLPSTFTYSLTPTNVILAWEPPDGDFYYYELRKGTEWDFSEKILTTNNSRVILDPVLVGTHTYLLKTINVDGVFSSGFLTVNFTTLGIPSFLITPFVVTNSVTLTWNEPPSIFKIDKYLIYKNGNKIAENTGTFYATSEQVGGEYTFKIIAVDLAGNQSAPSEVTVTLTGVTDYIFYASLVSNLSGIIVNGRIRGNRLFVCILEETYEQHFASRGWASPAAQIAAGYPLWLSPFATTASYEEIFDFGVSVSSVVVNINWAYEIFAGSFTFGIEAWVSDDGIVWSDEFNVSSFYVPSVRYVKVKLNFTGADDKSLAAFRELTVSLNVKKEQDGGFSTSYASDPDGTAVLFNKPFVDIDAITVTPDSDLSYYATHIFVDSPYPTGFLVKVFNNTGARVTSDIRWVSRGIV